MPLQETVTIVNNSGKIISTGKHLLSFFKEARGAYQDKKAQLNGEQRNAPSQAYSQPQSPYQGYQSYSSPQHGYRSLHHSIQDRKYEDDDYNYYTRRRSHDAGSSTSSRRSHGHARSSHRHHEPSSSRQALTESNLRTLSETSSTHSESGPRTTYHSPYAETVPLDMALSRIDIHKVPLPDESSPTTVMPRRHSEPDMPTGPKDKIDMNLAYGNVPPDLAERIDLDPGPQGREARAQQLVKRIEGLLDEAQCIHHSATAMIKHLQQKPDAAAQVALSLAELSCALSKLSPAFLGLVKGASPAVFGLLASPQFLIATGIAVGVTVVMFGGWKIVKRVTEAADQGRRALPPFPAQSETQPLPEQQNQGHEGSQVLQSEHSDQGGNGVDEALFVDEELSSIETWRRGILPGGVEDDESADVELITPEADRATRKTYGSIKYKQDWLEQDMRSYRSNSRKHAHGSERRSHHSMHKSEKDLRSQYSHKSDKDIRSRYSHKSDKDLRSQYSHKSDRDISSRHSHKGDKETRSSDGKSRHESRDGEHIQDDETRRRRDRGSRSVVSEGGLKKGPKSVGHGSTVSDSAAFRSKARHGDNMLKAIFSAKRDKLVAA
ncbi:hypothetical protein CDD82_6950 [Ophiocordyceps australis]|uniref:Uncharacterized protein n=1 Tax=Ophiocordyceps australis TaxID=1399860 RepID=A0A2C5YML0_9HYPO|nr:hypothetical protein CDD82_6950 [Ophiocordyceps australis]